MSTIRLIWQPDDIPQGSSADFSPLRTGTQIEMEKRADVRTRTGTHLVGELQSSGIFMSSGCILDTCTRYPVPVLHLSSTYPVDTFRSCDHSDDVYRLLAPFLELKLSILVASFDTQACVRDGALDARAFHRDDGADRSPGVVLRFNRTTPDKQY